MTGDPDTFFFLPRDRRFSQVYILDSLLSFTPTTSMDAEQLGERISVRLQHANSAVVLTTIKVLLYLMNYMEDESLIRALERKMGPPLGEYAEDMAVGSRTHAVVSLCAIQSRYYPLDLRFNMSVSELSFSSFSVDPQSCKTKSRCFSASITTPSTSNSLNWKLCIGWQERRMYPRYWPN